MNNDTKVREKVNEQLSPFTEILSEGLKKPKKKFIHQMLFGIQASRDIKLSEIARSLGEEIKLIKTEIRLHRNLKDNNLWLHLNRKLLEHSAKRIEKKIQ